MPLNATACAFVDAMTVVIDLGWEKESRLPDLIIDGFSQVTGFDFGPTSATELRISGSPGSFDELLHRIDSTLGEQAGTQFLLLIGSYFHELRHVYETVATCLGQDLIAQKARILDNIPVLLTRLRAWRAAYNRPIPLSLRRWWKELDGIEDSWKDFFESEVTVSVITDAVRRQSHVGISRLCTDNLLEASAYLFQICCTGHIFGEEAKNRVQAHLVDLPNLRKYFEVLRDYHQRLKHRHGDSLSMYVEDLSTAWWAAMCGLIPARQNPRARTSPPILFDAFLSAIGVCQRDISSQEIIHEFAADWDLMGPAATLEAYADTFRPATHVSDGSESMEDLLNWQRCEMLTEMIKVVHAAPTDLFSVEGFVSAVWKGSLPGVSILVLFNEQTLKFQSGNGLTDTKAELGLAAMIHSFLFEGPGKCGLHPINSVIKNILQRDDRLRFRDVDTFGLGYTCNRNA